MKRNFFNELKDFVGVELNKESSAKLLAAADSIDLDFLDGPRKKKTPPSLELVDDDKSSHLTGRKVGSSTRQCRTYDITETLSTHLSDYNNLQDFLNVKRHIPDTIIENLYKLSYASPHAALAFEVYDVFVNEIYFNKHSFWFPTLSDVQTALYHFGASESFFRISKKNISDSDDCITNINSPLRIWDITCITCLHVWLEVVRESYHFKTERKTQRNDNSNNNSERIEGNIYDEREILRILLLLASDIKVQNSCEVYTSLVQAIDTLISSIDSYSDSHETEKTETKTKTEKTETAITETETVLRRLSHELINDRNTDVTIDMLLDIISTISLSTSGGALLVNILSCDVLQDYTRLSPTNLNIHMEASISSISNEKTTSSCCSKPSIEVISKYMERSFRDILPLNNENTESFWNKIEDVYYLCKLYEKLIYSLRDSCTSSNNSNSSGSSCCSGNNSTSMKNDLKMISKVVDDIHQIVCRRKGDEIPDRILLILDHLSKFIERSVNK